LLVLFRIGRGYAGGGIVTRAERLAIIDAFTGARCVFEDAIARSAKIFPSLPTPARSPVRSS
jgi:hypothetical protein